MIFKINETVFASLILFSVAVPFYGSYYNKKIIKETSQKQQAEEFAEKIIAADFLTKFEQQEDIQDRLSIVAQKYKASPGDRNIVDEYVYLLNTSGNNEQAYIVIDKYFKETPKEDYWNDVDLWIDHAVASINTKRCLEAATNGWHIFMRTEENSEKQKFAGAIVSRALNEEGCVE